jgi:hypothetical protein
MVITLIIGRSPQQYVRGEVAGMNVSDRAGLELVDPYQRSKDAVMYKGLIEQWRKEGKDRIARDGSAITSISAHQFDGSSLRNSLVAYRGEPSFKSCHDQTQIIVWENGCIAARSVVGNSAIPDITTEHFLLKPAGLNEPRRFVASNMEWILDEVDEQSKGGDATNFRLSSNYNNGNAVRDIRLLVENHYDLIRPLIEARGYTRTQW